MTVLIGIGVVLGLGAYVGFMIWLITRSMQISFLMLSTLRLLVGLALGLALGFGLLPAAAGLPLGVLLTAGLWYGFAFVRSRMGKWHTLARRYHRDGDFGGARWSFKTGLLGKPGPQGLGHPLIAMQAWLVLGTDQGGLFLSHHLVGKPFHPSLYIPWDAVTVTRPEKMLGWFKNMYVDLNLGPDGIVLRLDRKFASRLLEQHGHALPPLSNGRPAQAIRVRTA